MPEYLVRRLDVQTSVQFLIAYTSRRRDVEPPACGQKACGQKLLENSL